ncbi:MAG: hypothetical protein A2015_09100 [Spirochaetes bacterium GWF1_31_7]|nr:MAG: hypothetical protein A2Y30_09120 [Spirochaetes bacterium GWE1_32_154]OHD44854.1 MAG: hypothetical protein A2Y29_09260 [Spirochaetes bacterium GWE2_31_10]OHD47645.1 MAG: hypothetical protein A2015_09100 [Spirochaetes bacterium GWF1_31_7]OHD74170.1 MAG: hypothetical protein A2355_01975 [Spirochaetes bacterium RIFOXYB1_FULL_32_8]HBD94422.1 hypothetical protein [Spirochaetia bacterium]
MNKEQLISGMAEKTGKTKTETKKIIESIFDELTSVLSEEKSFTITSFGNFSVVKRERRKGFNPSIEKFMMLPPKLKPRFKTSEILKEKINKNGRK